MIDHHIERPQLSETRLQPTIWQTTQVDTGLEEIGLSSPEVQLREQHWIGEPFGDPKF
jgi:hypothetical protein